MKLILSDLKPFFPLLYYPILKTSIMLNIDAKVLDV